MVITLKYPGVTVLKMALSCPGSVRNTALHREKTALECHANPAGYSSRWRPPQRPVRNADVPAARGKFALGCVIAISVPLKS